MASEQTKVKKKKSRNLDKEKHCPQILYRHQDCIPNHNCEQHKLFELKQSETSGDNKLAGTQQINNLTIKKVNINPKNARKPEKTKETELICQANDIADKSNEELSKSRRRRIRKRRLLTSLAPSLKTNNTGLSVENTISTKPSPNTCSASSVPPVPATNNNSGDLNKSSPKNSRKRFEKNLGFRNKSIKSKTLIDTTNQSKSDLIKSIEEKTLNSLLQTLAPLTNSSPKREKISSTPIFSFPERRLNSGNTKVDKDSVFYFGETKRQLEQLTSELNKTSTSAQSNQLNGHISASKSKSSENCFPISPLYNNKISNSTAVKQNISSSKVLSLTDIENRSPFSLGLTNLPPKELAFKSVSQEDKKIFPKEQFDLNQFYLHTCLTNIAHEKVSSEINTPINQNINTSLEKSEPLQSSISSHSISNNFEALHKETKSDLSNMKSPDESIKPNKSREEILLEREAKKAAKLAAKASKTNQTKKESSGNENKKAEQSEVLKCSNKESNPGNTSTGPENVHQKKSLTDHNLATNDSTTKVYGSQDRGKEETIKSKAELKAERRAKQEAQRAAKASAKSAPQKEKTALPKPIEKIKKEHPKDNSTSVQPEKKQEIIKTTTQPKPKLFSHLYQEKTQNQILKLGALHPSIVRLGVQYANRVVVGSNARCVALLHALKQMIKAYSTPTEKEFSRGLEEELGPVTDYLHQCRPLAVSMINALKHIKRSLVQLPNTISDVEARRKICDLVDTYIYEQIDKAGEAISQAVEEKIANGDTILTYGCSSIVCRILVESHLKGKKFRVVVVDGMPWQEGREMLRRLVDKGLSCTYVLITAASFIMREASKVLLGAHALLANGCVMSRAGSSQVAMLAHCYNVPVLVCCETHKFSERVQTDAFVYNELGELCCDKIKDKSRVVTNLTPLSLAYDITPPDLVSAVVTERGILPCTSVPVILRIKPSEFVL